MIYNDENLSFQILSAYRFQHNNGFFKVKERPYAAFTFRLGGTSEFDIGGKHFVAKEGDILFIPSDTPYEVEYLGSETIVIHLRDCTYREAELFRPQSTSHFRLLFAQLLEDFRDRGSVNRAKSAVYAILDAMAADRRIAHGGSDFEACLSFMEANFCDRALSIGQVAAAGFMSQSTLQRAFHERFGLSPKAYLGRLRMNRALELLVENRLSVKEIAFACGFLDEKFFSRAFKKKYGFPPSHLLKNANM